MLSEKEREFSLTLAKDSLRHYLASDRILSLNQKIVSEELGSDTDLLKRQGCFVTLQKNAQLRGCIGTIITEEALFKNIINNAISAGTRDPRFPEVTLEEFDQLQFEISVMGPVEPISSVDDIEIGVHGLIVHQGPFHGLLLPQVPVEWNWNKIQFLEQTCHKAGLHKDAWKESSTNISWFTAEVFSEE